jgi:hypothetical protein
MQSQNMAYTEYGIKKMFANAAIQLRCLSGAAAIHFGMSIYRATCFAEYGYFVSGGFEHNGSSLLLT